MNQASGRTTQSNQGSDHPPASGQDRKAAIFRPLRPRCEFAENPLGIDTQAPRFSWVVDHPSRGQRQSAYHLLVATRPALLRPGKADVWDSGIVRSAQSANVEFAGTRLDTATRCFWKVCVWDSDNTRSLWSDVAFFEMALLTPGDWHGQWIGAPSPRRGVSPLFRRCFSIAKRVRRARAYICGLGYYELRINGEKIGDHVLDPGWTDYTRRVLYAVYDITGRLRTGRNAVGIMLGEGWYGNDRLVNTFPKRNPHWLSTPRFLLQINIDFTDGTSAAIASDRSPAWQTTPGPIIENNIYDGETYDARREQTGWDEPEFSPGPSEGWSDVVAVAAPGGVLLPQILEPIKVVRDLSPATITNPRPGIYVYDIGQNLAGWARLAVCGPRGSAVAMKFSEVLGDDGLVNQENLRTAKATDTYVLKGECVETYEPRFTYHGFRYVQMEGFPGVPTLDTIVIRQVRSSVERSSRFVSGNALLNRIHECVAWTEESNLHSVPTDCPQRDERMGWLNDATVRIEECLCSFDTVRLLSKWEDDIADTQDASGMIRDTAPYCFSLEPAEAVNSSYLLIPWMLYVHAGDRRILERHYEGMRRWTEFLGTRARDDIVDFSHYGDWASPIAECENSGSAKSARTPGPLMSTGYYYYNNVIMADIARVLGRDEDAAGFIQASCRIAEAFNRTFLDAKGPRYAQGSQASNVFPLYLGLAPEPLQGGLMDDIIRDIAVHDDHMTTGNLCTRYLLEMLSEHGNIDVAFRLATQTTYPSWGFMIDNGATTIWERWEKATGGGMNSHNHPMYATVSLWMIKYLGGISPNPSVPGYERITIQPRLPAGLSYVDVSLRTVRGTVSSSWRRTHTGIALQVVIPFNCTAQIFVPKVPSPMTIREGAAVVWGEGAEAPGPRGLGAGVDSGGYVMFEAGSGTYCFIAAPR